MKIFLRIRFVALYATGILLLFITACNVINPSEEIPAYLYIPAAQLNTVVGTEGENSHEITDGWVYINDDLVGVYELPATIPVLKKGYCKVDVRPGIRRDGQGDTRVFYPFYSTFTTYLTLEPKRVDTVSTTALVYTYRPNVKFAFLESFDDPSSKFELLKRAAKDTFVRVTDPGLTYGATGGSGAIQVEADTTIVEVATISSYPLPNAGAEVYLEFDYKADYQFTVGIYSTQGGSGDVVQVPILTVFSSDKWRKMYLSLRNDIGSQPDGSKYKIFIGTAHTDPTTKPRIYLDNLKLVHFE